MTHPQSWSPLDLPLSSLFNSVQHRYREKSWRRKKDREESLIECDTFHNSSQWVTSSERGTSPPAIALNAWGGWCCSTRIKSFWFLLLLWLCRRSNFAYYNAALRGIFPSFLLLSTPSFVNNTNIKIHKNQGAERSMYLEIPTQNVILTRSSKPWGSLVFSSTESVV